MAIQNLDDFKSKIKGGGARPNLFRAIVTFPEFATSADSELTAFMCKSAQLPGSTIGMVMVPFRGRQLKLAGDRTFEDWTISIINDTTMDVRNAFEQWMNAIDQHYTNTGLSNPYSYQTDMEVHQLNKEGKTTKEYYLRGVFPTNISPIEVSYDSTDTIEEFSVTLAYQYWESPNTTT